MRAGDTTDGDRPAAFTSVASPNLCNVDTCTFKMSDFRQSSDREWESLTTITLNG